MRALVDGDLEQYVDYKLAASERFDAVGDQRNASIQRARLGYGYSMLGALPAPSQLRARTRPRPSRRSWRSATGGSKARRA